MVKQERKKTAENADGLRTCIASGEKKPKDQMVRFVIGPDAKVVPDLDEKLPGRGLWLSAKRDMIHTACARNLFAKRARCQVAVEADLADRVAELLARRCVELLRLSRRSGQLAVGFDEVRRRLDDGGTGFLVTASDAAPVNRRRIAGPAAGLAVGEALTGDELGSVMGRERIAHALVAAGGLADRLARDMGRLAGLRPLPAAA